jgi:L,D-transpeptidase YcbB
MLASHLVAGRTNPESLRPEWIAVRREADPVSTLEEAIVSGDLGGVLDRLAPAYPDYARLRAARARDERIALDGGWPTVPDGPKLELDMVGDRVRLLRDRLRITGDIETQERWRWLPQDLGDRYLIVNIPNFELDLVEDGRVTMNMRAVVGRRYRRTPVFSDRMTYLVLNPRWNVPSSIATQDILPKLRTDPNYLTSQNMKVFRDWGADPREFRHIIRSLTDSEF